MNLTQNDRLNQVTADTLVVGVDIGSREHFARAFDWLGFQKFLQDHDDLCRLCKNCVVYTWNSSLLFLLWYKISRSDNF